MKHGKKRKKSRFLDFEKKRKNVKNVEVITYRSIGLKTTVTTLNQFCCPSRNYQGHMWGLFQSTMSNFNIVLMLRVSCQLAISK